MSARDILIPKEAIIQFLKQEIEKIIGRELTIRDVVYLQTGEHGKQLDAIVTVFTDEFIDDVNSGRYKF